MSGPSRSSRSRSTTGSSPPCSCPWPTECSTLCAPSFPRTSCCSSKAASAAAVMHAGGQARFADVDPETLCLDARRLEAALTPATAGVVVVHIGGMVTPDIEGITRLCRARGLWLVEDAAHAQGATYLGR